MAKIYKTIPFFPNVSQTIKKQFKNTKINISFSNHNCLKNLIQKLFENFDPLIKSDVYRLDCTCGMFYVDRTFRNFQIRCKEHFQQIKLNKKQPYASNFAEHYFKFRS